MNIVMKRLLVTAGIALAVLVNTQTRPAVAQDDPLPKATIAIVDIQHIMRESAAAAHIRSQIDAVRSRFQSELDKQETALRDGEEELKRQRSILAPEVFEERRKAFEEQVLSVQRNVQEKNQQLEMALGKSTGEIRNALIPILRALLEERNATLLLDKSQILVSQKGLELTTEALLRLNEALPLVKMEMPAEGAAGG